MTVINHAEPLDSMIYSDPGSAFRDIAACHAPSADPQLRSRLVTELQRQLAAGAANVYIANPGQQAVARKALWANSPIFANDLLDVGWQ